MARRDIIWLTPAYAGDSGVASLAANGGEGTVYDFTLDDPNSGVVYQGGTVVGGQFFLSVDSINALDSRPLALLMVLPPGLTVPSVNTEAKRKQQEQYMWIVSPMQGRSGNVTWDWDFKVRTARRVEPGGRIVLTLLNQSGVAFGAGAKARVLYDLYYVPD